MVSSLRTPHPNDVVVEDSEQDELQEDQDSDSSEFDEFRTRAQVSPAKMTARQRSKQNKDVGEELIQLPNREWQSCKPQALTITEVTSSRKQILTDAEKAQKKEETARRRKRQLDQKLEDEKVRFRAEAETHSRWKLSTDSCVLRPVVHAVKQT